MRVIDDRFREDNERRVERMNSWIEMAEGSDHDHVRFVFYWIAYEAAYQNEKSKLKEWKERQVFHSRLARHDRGRLQGILRRRREDVVRIIELRQASRFFWKRQPEDEDVKIAAEWESRFRTRAGSAIRRLDKAVGSGVKRDTADTLDGLFDNLNIVRQQIVHGGSAGSRSQGRTQVILGAGLLKALVPCFRDSIESNVDQDWGEPPYPRVGSGPDEKCPPPWL